MDVEIVVAAADATVDSAAVAVVGHYCLYSRDTVVDRIPEVLEEDKNIHLQRLGPMQHNFARTGFVVVVVAVVAGWC